MLFVAAALLFRRTSLLFFDASAFFGRAAGVLGASLLFFDASAFLGSPAGSFCTTCFLGATLLGSATLLFFDAPALLGGATLLVFRTPSLLGHAASFLGGTARGLVSALLLLLQATGLGRSAQLIFRGTASVGGPPGLVGGTALCLFCSPSLIGLARLGRLPRSLGSLSLGGFTLTAFVGQAGGIRLRLGGSGSSLLGRAGGAVAILPGDVRIGSLSRLVGIVARPVFLRPDLLRLSGGAAFFLQAALALGGLALGSASSFLA